MAIVVAVCGVTVTGVDAVYVEGIRVAKVVATVGLAARKPEIPK